MVKNDKELYISIDGTGRWSFTAYARYENFTAFDYAVAAAKTQIQAARKKGFKAKAAIWNPDHALCRWPALSSNMNDAELMHASRYLSCNVKRALGDATISKALQTVCDDISGKNQTHLMVVTDGYVQDEAAFRASLTNLLQKQPSIRIDFLLTSIGRLDDKDVQTLKAITSRFNNVVVHECAACDLNKAIQARRERPNFRI